MKLGEPTDEMLNCYVVTRCDWRWKRSKVH